MFEEPQPPSRVKNLSYTAVAGLAGCVIITVVLVALFTGLWLDAQFQVRGPFTVGLVVLSVPVTLWVVVRVVLALVRAIQPPPPPKQQDTDTSL